MVGAVGVSDYFCPMAAGVSGRVPFELDCRGGTDGKTYSKHMFLVLLERTPWKLNRMWSSTVVVMVLVL